MFTIITHFESFHVSVSFARHDDFMFGSLDKEAWKKFVNNQIEPLRPMCKCVKDICDDLSRLC